MNLLLKNQSPFPIIHLFQASFTCKFWKSTCTHIFTPVSSATGFMLLCHPLSFLLASKCSWASLLISAKQAGRGIRNTELPQAMEIGGQAAEEPPTYPTSTAAPAPGARCSTSHMAEPNQGSCWQPGGRRDTKELKRTRLERFQHGSIEKGMPGVLQSSGEGNDWRYHGRERWQSAEVTQTQTQITAY